jgi:hypothetical protein
MTRVIMGEVHTPQSKPYATGPRSTMSARSLSCAADSAFEPATLVRVMDNLGIAKALVMQGPLFGFLNEEVADAVRRHPGRLAGAMQIDPKDERCLAEMERWKRPASPS